LAENHSALCEISLTDNFPSLAFEGLCKFREAEEFPRDASSTFHLDNAHFNQTNAQVLAYYTMEGPTVRALGLGTELP
jgi:hypothetical protein